jgi:hypothetical protein
MTGTLSGSWLSHQPSVLTFAAVTLGKVMAWRKEDSDMLSGGLPFVEGTGPSHPSRWQPYSWCFEKPPLGWDLDVLRAAIRSPRL